MPCFLRGFATAWITVKRHETMSAFRPRQQRAGIPYDFLPPDRPAAAKTVRRFEPPRDVVDAEFVVLKETRRPASSPYNDNSRMRAKPANRPVAPAPRFFDRVVDGTERALRRVPEKTFSAIVAALFVTVFGLAGGFSALAGASLPEQVVSRTLDFSHVTLTPQTANGMRVLLVNGILENTMNETSAVPQIRADLVSGGRVVASTFIMPPVAEIGAAQSHGFSARLPHPGGKTPEVRLSFAPQDAPAS